MLHNSTEYLPLVLYLSAPPPTEDSIMEVLQENGRGNDQEISIESPTIPVSRSSIILFLYIPFPCPTYYGIIFTTLLQLKLYLNRLKTCYNIFHTTNNTNYICTYITTLPTLTFYTLAQKVFLFLLEFFEVWVRYLRFSLISISIAVVLCANLVFKMKT